MEAEGAASRSHHRRVSFLHSPPSRAGLMRFDSSLAAIILPATTFRLRRNRLKSLRQSLRLREAREDEFGVRFLAALPTYLY